jgi:hypothetical protein
MKSTLPENAITPSLLLTIGQTQTGVGKALAALMIGWAPDIGIKMGMKYRSVICNVVAFRI